MNNIAILGSTGSIGRQTLEVVRAFPDKFRVVALAAGKNTGLLASQIKEFKPELIYYRDEQVETLLAATNYELLSAEDIARHPQVDTVVIAISGTSGLSPTLAAVRAGKKVCLANKESIVMAGKIIIEEAKNSGARILPVDSEHSAIWQCISGEQQKASRLILTASGGPFRNFPASQLSEVTAEQALRHPSWQMGKKVTIDSATLMNKGLEIIEAHWLFGMPFKDITVLIHPQSIVHSMVEFIDGTVKAQLSYPDMRLPIQYALSFPERLANPRLPKIDWNSFASLNFEPPDYTVFPCLRLATEAGEKGGTYPAVLCAADEIAVELFLAERISFPDIARLVEETLSKHEPIAEPDLEDIMAADAWARQKAWQLATEQNLC